MDVGKALEAATEVVLAGDDVPSDALARAAVLAFLRAMPDASRISDVKAGGQIVGQVQLFNLPTRIVSAIEESGR